MKKVGLLEKRMNEVATAGGLIIYSLDLKEARVYSYRNIKGWYPVEKEFTLLGAAKGVLFDWFIFFKYFDGYYKTPLTDVEFCNYLYQYILKTL